MSSGTLGALFSRLDIVRRVVGRGEGTNGLQSPVDSCTESTWLGSFRFNVEAKN